MIVLENKFLSVLVNILLAIWQLPQIIVGLIALAIFHNYTMCYNPEAKVRVIEVDKGYLFGNACFSLGPIIFTTPHCNGDTVRHETGHSVQSLYMGPFFFIVILASVPRFWIRRWFNKSHEWYLSGWPESSAEKLGHTKRHSDNQSK